MRKQIQGLSMLIEEHLEGRAFSGDLFVFSNRSRNIVKILYWAENGFALWQKRLERDRFTWPENEKDVLEIDQNALGWLLKGLDIDQAHPPADYTILS